MATDELAGKRETRCTMQSGVQFMYNVQFPPTSEKKKRGGKSSHSDAKLPTGPNESRPGFNLNLRLAYRR